MVLPYQYVLAGYGIIIIWIIPLVITQPPCLHGFGTGCEADLAFQTVSIPCKSSTYSPPSHYLFINHQRSE